MLSAERVWFRHERQGPWVLRGVSLRLPPGRVIGLLGPSGSGKSTLGSVLAGHRAPAAGSVRVDEVPATTLRGVRPVQLLAQRPETAMNPRWRIEQILNEAGLPVAGEKHLVDTEWLDRFPHEISGGELQRVNLARALRATPSYLVADEISSSLDPIAQADLWERVLATARDGVGVLAISHDPDLLAAVADEVVELGALVG
jgi:peptide/nickel transport system ATP-binding protein